MSILSKTKIAPPVVVVIGGGATGTGIAKQAAEQGFKVVLIERGTIGSGTTGHFHGILHSGARYAVNDPLVAAECYRENQMLRSVIPSAITDTGGMFVAYNEQEVAHADVLIQACSVAGIPVTEISVEQALQAEPMLNKSLLRAFTVPDGTIDGDELVNINAKAARQAEVPATFIEHHSVAGFKRKADEITAVTIKHVRTGETEDIACDYVINASGVWAGSITKFADIELDMIFDKGTMIVFKQQLSKAVINRCRPEDDGDLLAPHNGHSIMGTTSRVITSPDDCIPTQEEADVLLREGTVMAPSMSSAEALRIYAGVRPLLRSKADEQENGTNRSVSRAFRVLDHAEQGVENFISITGGKVTLYRCMAEATIDLLCEKRGRSKTLSG
ncbi:hypothetical protein BH09PAT3_BH09PAT3_4150 [soil metagenome]